jgi:predicted Zn-dependent peptidase
MYSIKTMPNGMRTVGERIPHFRSAALGVWVGVGSIHEGEGEHGLSHLIEHMVFKGTKKRSARELASVMDAVGGHLNAYTTKECTCFYVRVVDEHIPLAVDVLSDLVTNALFTEEALEMEKQVVLEEIAMVEDTPEDLVGELLGDAYYGSHNLAKPILGLADEIKSYTRKNVVDYFEKHYCPGNFVFANAGNYDEQKMDELLTSSFAADGKPKNNYVTAPFEHNGLKKALVKKKNIEQLHISVAFRGYPRMDDKLFPMLILNNILGGGMSSRLFQRIREERGLVYSVYTYPASYNDSGMFAFYAGLNPANVEEVMKIVREELESMRRGEISEEEFVRSREQLKGGYVLGLDGISSRMADMGKSLIMSNAIRTEAEVLQKINDVKPEDVAAVAQYIFDSRYSAASAVGKLPPRKNMEKILLG